MVAPIQEQLFANNASTTIPAGLSAVATSFTVFAGTGVLFPALTTPGWFFNATIINNNPGDPGYGQLEIVRVTARSTDTFTVVRAQEGTTAKTFPAVGNLIELRPTQASFDNLYLKISVPPLPPMYRQGGQLSHTTNTVTIAAANVRGAANNFDLLLAAPITKVIQAAGGWTAGSGNNGLFTGSLTNNTWYHVFLIRNDSTGAIDAGFDTSVTAANKPVGYTAYRRMGSVWVNNSGVINPFFQAGQFFRFVTPVVVSTSANVPSGPTLLIVNTPPGVVTQAHMGYYLGASIDGMLQMVASAGAVSGGATVSSTMSSGPSRDEAGTVEVFTNTGRQIVVQKLAGTDSGNFNLNTIGWTDFIGE